MVFYRFLFACFCLLSGPAVSARTIRTTVWISGGLEGILYSGPNAPGLLGVLLHRANDPSPGMWIDVGGSRDFALLHALPADRLPIALVPGEDLLRIAGVEGATVPTIPSPLLNAGILPQFPGATLPFPPSHLHRTLDGIPLRVVGLLAPDAPWTIPPQRLHPLRVLEPKAALAEALPAWRAQGAELRVLCLPERADATEWTRAHPDFDVVVLPAAAPAEAIPIDQGRRWRVRPAPHGRAVIRLNLAWDTVDRRIIHLDATVEWVGKPDLGQVDWPRAVQDRLRPLHPPPPADRWPQDAVQRELVGGALRRKGEAALILLPEMKRNVADPATLADAWKVAWFPRDTTWARVHVDAVQARAWTAQAWPGYHWLGPELPRGGPVAVLLPADFATRAFRSEMDQAGTEIMPWTSRDILPEIRK